MRKGEETGQGDDDARTQSRWLRAIEKRLAPRMPLGSVLRAMAPRYAAFGLTARIEAARAKDPQTLEAQVRAALEKRLAVVGPGARDFGVAVTRRDVIAWIRAVPGVQRIVELTLFAGGSAPVDEVKVARRGLPRLDPDPHRTSIEVFRPGPRSTA
jgi:hypothetical protein